MKASVVIIVARSSSERRLTAEMIPTGIAIASQMMTEPTTSMTVAGRRSKMITLPASVRTDSCVPKLNGPVRVVVLGSSSGVNTPLM